MIAVLWGNVAFYLLAQMNLTTMYPKYEMAKPVRVISAERINVLCSTPTK